MFESKFKQFSATAIITLLLSTSHATADETIKFYTDYNTAIKEAKATGRPIFLEFRCGP